MGIPEANNPKDEDTQTVVDSEEVEEETASKRKKGKKKNTLNSDEEGSGSGEDEEEEEEDEDEGDSDYDDQGDLDSGDGEQEGDNDSNASESAIASDIGSNSGSKLHKPELSLEQMYMNSNGILVDANQLEKEKSYISPSEPEMKSRNKLQRLDIRYKLDMAAAFLVNYVAEDYRFLLKKFLSILSIIPQTVRALIVPLPKGATSVDQFFAKRIQRMIAGMPDHSLMVLFITHESHKQLIKHFYKVM